MDNRNYYKDDCGDKKLIKKYMLEIYKKERHTVAKI